MAWSDKASLVNQAVRNTFGESVTYTPASTGIAQSITAPFDANAEVVEMQGDVPVVGFAPVIDVVLADLSVMPVGRPIGNSTTADTCTVRGVRYAVVKVEPGGHGTARCVLARIP